MRDIPVLFERKALCCGCSACASICHEQAITMEEDDEGFEYPRIDESKCVRCYRCAEACPIKNK